MVGHFLVLLLIPTTLLVKLAVVGLWTGSGIAKRKHVRSHSI